MKHHGPVALRSHAGGLILSLQNEYDRELLFESIDDRVRRDRWVDVSMRGAHWRATLIAPHQALSCTTCGEPLTIAHRSGTGPLCTRCRKDALH